MGKSPVLAGRTRAHGRTLFPYRTVRARRVQMRRHAKVPPSSPIGGRRKMELARSAA